MDVNFTSFFAYPDFSFTFAVQINNRTFGSLAQLVQSICLTSRGSGVRTPQLPQIVRLSGTAVSFRCMSSWFYILYSPTADRYYIGHTTELPTERLRKHNSNHNGFTGKFRDWVIVYLEEHVDKRAAYKRELQVKAWKNRERIERLIKLASEHPDS